MTVNERLEMYREKDSFIKKLDLVLTTPTPRGMSIYGIEYEVYRKIPEDWFQEVIVLTFDGDAICPIIVTGNSHTANLCDIAKNISAPDFSAVHLYNKIKETHTKVDLD